MRYADFCKICDRIAYAIACSDITGPVSLINQTKRIGKVYRVSRWESALKFNGSGLLIGVRLSNA